MPRRTQAQQGTVFQVTLPDGFSTFVIMAAGNDFAFFNVRELAQWSAEHVEERLQDYFAGRPNRIVEFFKIIRRYDPNTGQELKQPGLILPQTRG